ncbi:arylsulfatase B-like [Mytilus californianus]|uniref:arylsulfatase B-like n=1 Tax=Mytilus californianus TaxID=6549 RepID=UPI002246A047|nr:arylsulfatase B-like [Mytilus californianus]
MIRIAFAILCFATTVRTKRQPNILFIIADDYGYNDIGYHGSEIKTPVLDRLAAGGVKLENYYVQPICSPTRSQLMTGRYQIHTGIQHGIFWPLQQNGLPLQDPTLADKLREAGYSTHAVGKWHLGFFKEEYLPTNRGFDTFFGILNGKADHYQYNDSAMGINGLDLRDGIQRVNNEYRGQYSTNLYSKKAVEIVDKHDSEKPLFMYLSFQAVHLPLQVPEKYLKQYGDIKDMNRRVYAGMTSAMDEAIGDVVKSFESKGLWQDTLLVFTTDNGGQVLYGGDNWPLRGWKGSLWEGGIKAVGFVHGQMIKKKGTISKELIHVSDWFPTLINLADGSLKRTNPLDGVDQWRTISLQNNLIQCSRDSIFQMWNVTLYSFTFYGEQSQRKTILHNIDPLMSHAGERKSGKQFDARERAALRHNEWKIITGDPGNGSWIYTSTRGQNQNKLYERPNDKNIWLFNIENDPYEKHDLSTKRPEVVFDLLEMLANFALTSVPCFYPENDFMADPKYHEGYWGPWIHTQVITEELSRPSYTKTFRYSLLSIIILVLYCLYYRYMKRKRSHKSSPC